MLYPVLNEARALLDLGGVWRFETAGCDSYDPARCGAPLDHAMTMAVPASYNDQKDDCNLRAHYGFVLYQTTFTLPRALQNERIVLRFGAVTHAAEVYLNGVLLGAHKGGFLPFEFEVQNVIQSGENLLTVAVDNRVNYSTLPVGNETFRYFGSVDNPGIPSIEEAKARMAPQNLPNFDFFNYAGIIRPVKLYTTPYSYIEDVTLIPHVENGTGVVDYRIKTVDGNPGDLSFGPEKEVQVTVLDEDGTAVAERQGCFGYFYYSKRAAVESGRRLPLPCARHLWRRTSTKSRLGCAPSKCGAPNFSSTAVRFISRALANMRTASATGAAWTNA